MISLFTYQFLLFMEVWTLIGTTIIWDNLYVIPPFLLTFLLGILFTYKGTPHRQEIFFVLLVLSSLFILLGNLISRLHWLSYIGCFLAVGWVITMNAEFRFKLNKSLQYTPIIGFIASLILPDVNLLNNIVELISWIPLVILSIILGVLFLKERTNNDQNDTEFADYKGFKRTLPSIIRLVLNFLLIYSAIIFVTYATSIWRVIFGSTVIIGFMVVLDILPKFLKNLYRLVLMLSSLGLGVIQSYVLNGTFLFIVFLTQTVYFLFVGVNHFLE